MQAQTSMPGLDSDHAASRDPSTPTKEAQDIHPQSAAQRALTDLVIAQFPPEVDRIADLVCKYPEQRDGLMQKVQEVGAEGGVISMSATPVSTLQRASSVIIICASILAGCAHAGGARDVTPWLRIEGWRPSDFLLAESGQNHDRFKIERKVADHWQTLTDDGGSDCAFAFAGGARAVVSNDLLSVEGSLVHLACAGEVRGTPGGDAIDCFENQGPGNAAGLTIRHFDRDGRATGVRHVALQGDVLPFPDFVGYRGADLVYFAKDDGRCASYVLRTDDRIEALGAPGDCANVRRMAESISTPGIIQRQIDGRRCFER